MSSSSGPVLDSPLLLDLLLLPILTILCTNFSSVLSSSLFSNTWRCLNFAIDFGSTTLILALSDRAEAFNKAAWPASMLKYWKAILADRTGVARHRVVKDPRSNRSFMNTRASKAFRCDCTFSISRVDDGAVEAVLLNELTVFFISTNLRDVMAQNDSDQLDS